MANEIILDPTKFEAAKEKLKAENPLFAVGEAEIRGVRYKAFTGAPPNLVGVFFYGVQHGEKDFLLYEDERLSFVETWSRACRLAKALAEDLGVKKGDHVAIAMRNQPEWCIAFMAVVSLGAVVTPLNAWWKTEEFDYALKDCGARIVIVDGRRLELLKPLRKALGLTLVLARDAGDGADHLYEDLLKRHEDAALPLAEIAPDDDFAIYYTSGSTGHAKGVVLTHRGAVTALLSWSFLASAVKEAIGRSPLGDNPGLLVAIPLFHVTGSHVAFLFSWLVGRKIALMYRWDAGRALDLINGHALTNILGVPSQSYALMEAAGKTGAPSLLDLGSGGAKRPPDQVRALKEKFPQANPSSGYGLTETNGLGCHITLSDYQARPDSTGRAVPPVTEIKIMTEAGEAPSGEAGEIWIKSPANFRGYLNLPEETEKALTAEGWFRTGDIGRMDEDGFLYIVDRMKDIIIRGGENVSPLEVENVAYAHPDVAEAVVFATPDEALGERVGIVVYPKAGGIDLAALRVYFAQHLADFKAPERYWISPAPLPRLGAEKFDKRLVRQIALQNPPTLTV